MRSTYVLTLYVFVMLVLLTSLLWYMRNEHFTSSDFYDKYYDIVSVPIDFYSSTTGTVLPETHYAAEVNDRFFIDAFDEEKKRFEEIGKTIPDNGGQETVEKATRSRLLKVINNYVLKMLNMRLDSSEKYLFNMVYSNLGQSLLWEKDSMYLSWSNHVLYRDTKVYGVSLSLFTMYDAAQNSVYTMGYKLNGFIFEDKLSDFIPSNLETNVLAPAYS
jgi:hypothetical protein